MPSDSRISSGQTLGHYTIVDRLGKGGMGEVFLAHDSELDRKVAIKLLSSDFVSDEDRLRLFQREARVLASLNHPNIVTVFSIEQAADLRLLVMEFVEGRTLRAVSGTGWKLNEFLAVAQSMADALSAAHERGIVHRDLKPENVMLTQSGRVKVLDFGLAKRHVAAGGNTSAAFATMATAGAIYGTIPYMSPEQVEGREVDHRSDLFSLGVMFYEMLTGRLPFGGDSAARVISAILRDSPPPLSAARPDLPPALTATIALCLEKDPAARVQSAKALARQLALVAMDSGLPLDGATQPLRRSSARIAVDAARPSAAPVAVARDRRHMATAVLTLTFIVNWIETAAESAWTPPSPMNRVETARVFQWIEGNLSFEGHDLSSGLAVYGYSVTYFFVLPMLLALLLAEFALRADGKAYRVLCFSLVAAYLISLPFYVLFPVPERWAFPESQAMLLSDQWTTRLIEAIRPISGIDNCFPSFHSAASTIAVLLAFAFDSRFRTLVAPLGAAVLLSTFGLGIHWLADIVAGAAVGVISVWVAGRLVDPFGGRVVAASNHPNTATS